MNGTEKVVKHLEMIQAVIKRLAINSFLVKGGSIVFVITSQVLFATYIFFAFHEHNYLDLEKGVSFVLAETAVLIFLIVGFWLLDGFFLCKERLFRYHYDAVRKQDDTDFNMDVSIHKIRPYSSRRAAIFSATLVIFYTIEIIFVLFLPIVILFSDFWY